MIFNKEKIKYTEIKANIFALVDCKIKIGTKKICLKEKTNGINHDDLAKAALQHLLSYDKNECLELKKGNFLPIKAFTAYVVSGEYSINAKENVFSVS